MPTRSNSFGDTEFYQVKQEIKKRFDKILIALQKTVEKNGYAVVTVQRFRNCLNNPGLVFQDTSRLPFYSVTDSSSKRNKIHCVLCIVSYTVQLYWRFCSGNKEVKDIINEHITMLENIVEKELKAFEARKFSTMPWAYYLEEIK